MAKQIIPQGDSALPPPGFERNEEMAQRTDNLQQAAEERADALETEAIDPSKLRVENEIAQNFDPSTTMLKVSNPDVCFMYCWVYSGAHGLMITQKQIEGWLVVQGDDLEATEHKGIGADTTRRVGDTLLMRIPKDKYLVLERRRKAQANRFNDEATSFSDRAEKLAEQHNIPIYREGEVDARVLKRMMGNANARKVAGTKVNQLIRQGRMPGVR